MIRIKNKYEIDILRIGGRILADILDKIIEEVKPNISTEYLEKMACSLIDSVGGRAVFKNYKMSDNLYFPTALCVSINDEVVHAPALPSRILKSGDIVCIDIGMEYPFKNQDEFKDYKKNKFSKGGGYYTDMSKTIIVGKASKKAIKLVRVAKKALNIGIQEVRAGNNLNKIGIAIQDFVENNGFSVVRDFVGHGVGHKAHEDPQVLHYASDDYKNIILKQGMVIAIEPMINAGGWRVKKGKDDFTYLTADGSLSAQFEHTILVKNNGYEILTKKNE